jgi:putative nucleotidyltransferase with HDIG domain
MIRIYFAGTSATLSKLQAALIGFAQVTPNSAGAELQVYELRLADDLKRVPRSPATPVFLILAAREPKLIEQIRGYKVNGIFFLPIDGVSIKRKIITLFNVNTNEKAVGDDFETLKIKILAKAESIASLPAFAQKLFKLTQSDASTIQEITEQIKMDQSISGKVVRMVNSPFFGIRQTVSSIDRAVVLLGFNTLKNIALVAATTAYYNKSFEMYNMNGTRLFNHAYRVALIAEQLSKSCGADSDPIFLAGLLHDIGKILLADFLVKPAHSPDDEIRQLGTDHQNVAELILKRWQLSDDIIQIVKTHHAPLNTIPSQTVYYANLLEHTKDGGEEAYNICIDKALSVLPVANPDQTAEIIKNIIFVENE